MDVADDDDGDEGARFRSREEESFGAKFIAALRNEFGGHEVEKE